ncbi:MAG: phosphoglycerate mutase family protein [Gammaproteobacteria bacterium]|nr:phosphoglycerate mutase family protein [Gammaproteobacteria bacterium]
MSQIVRYLTHPQVRINPEQDVPQWSLNDVGRARVTSLAKRPGALLGTTRVVSSAETKAFETARPLADALDARLEVRPAMHENDRSATGFLAVEEFERVADQFFARPNESVRGWEKAADAQRRIVAEVDAVLSEEDAGDVLIVGHGGVGTLLFCALSNLPINRQFDQGPGGGGCWFAFEREARRPLSRWKQMEELVGHQAPPT